MASYIIEGGKRLMGEVEVSGSKNASLPILASTILNGGTNKLYNIPKISDTKITLEILQMLGCKVKRNNGKIIIDSKTMTGTQIPHELMHKMRSTVILAGAILGRFKEVTLSYPGGCDIGARPIDLHLSAFRKMGIQVEEKSGLITCKCDSIIGANINLDFPSVGATENVMLAAVFAEGETKIHNAAMEPEIVDLANCLIKMGAKIEGAGTNSIKIIGVSKLKEVSYKVMPDRIEAGTYLCAAAVTGGKVMLKNVCTEHIEPVINKLEECGCEFVKEKHSLTIMAPKKLKAVQIKTMPYPGFPTDMQAIFVSVLAVAKGTSVVVENIFENRYKYTAELNKMGAKIQIEGKTAIIQGKRKLYGTKVNSTDLRGGAAMIIAGLAAKGTTEVHEIQYIARGYENIEAKLQKLGANIRKTTSE